MPNIGVVIQLLEFWEGRVRGNEHSTLDRVPLNGVITLRDDFVLFFIYFSFFKMVTSTYWFILLGLVSLGTPRPWRLQ